MLESFPFGCTCDYLEDEDFVLFANGFRQLVAARIPSSGTVYFVGRNDTVPKLSTDPRTGGEISGAVEAMLRSELTSLILHENILLAFQLSEDRRLVVVVSKVDPVVAERGSADWLEGMRENLLREFVLVKQAYRDPETGLLNSAHLFTVLQSRSSEHQIAVILVEVPPRSRVLRDAFRNGQKAAASLIGFTDNRFLIHHLGQSVFALLVSRNDIGSVELFSSRLVQYLKKEHFYRVHIGSSRQDGVGVAGGKVLDQAWTALQAAGRRGPFSFCDFSVLANTVSHPLRSASYEIVREYRRLNRREDVFCVVNMSKPEKIDDLAAITDMLNLPGSAVMLGVDGGCFLYLPGLRGADGLEYAKALIERLGPAPGMSEVYAGVSAFPFKGFSRAETLDNARKALLHAAFFGAGHAVLFDAVSLNVSGDIYYSDGDLPRAVREYRRGLGCSPRDVNLLNSLGVAYALLNKNTLARSTFESVLEIDAQNYMAFYNLGLAAQQRGDLGLAVDCFEKAHIYSYTSEEGMDFGRDLKVQLGQLYCQIGKYQESIRYLEEWRAGASERQQRRILKYLGEAYLGIGKPRDAMTWLQRAHRRNEFDHDILGLLGTAIWQAGEGDDIALSLCGKSVDLAPENPLLRVRLAWVQLHAGHYVEALANLANCKGKKVDPAEVYFLKASLYQRLQQVAKTRYWANKVQQRCAKKSELYQKTQVLLESLQ